jgi:hypothetical protein
MASASASVSSTTKPARVIPITQIDATTWTATPSDPAVAPYVLRRQPDGHTSCSCPAYTYCRTQPAECKHSRALDAAYPLPVQEASWAERVASNTADRCIAPACRERCAGASPFCAGHMPAPNPVPTCIACGQPKPGLLADGFYCSACTAHLLDEYRASLAVEVAPAAVTLGHGWNRGSVEITPAGDTFSTLWS